MPDAAPPPLEVVGDADGLRGLARLGADAVVIALAAGASGPQPAAASAAIGQQLADTLRGALTRAGVTGKEGEVTTIVAAEPSLPALIVAVGIGAGGRGEVLRCAAGAGARAAQHCSTVALSLPVRDGEDVRAVAEGALMGAYRFDGYRSAPAAGQVERIVIQAPGDGLAGAREAASRAAVVARAVNLARDLVNTPPSHQHPVQLAAAARACASPALHVDVLDEQALRDGGFGGIVAVGQGALEPPCLVHMSYRCGVPSAPTLALVGKGITFDSGGLSLKRPDEMVDMKMDMAGAAAVIAATQAIAELGLAVDVEAWVPMAENMPGRHAIRPSDVVTMRSGLQVEVNDTDAEGRLILADAISRAADDHPDAIVDVATLTSGQIIALGHRTAGVMANDDGLRADVVAAAELAGEPSWPMPLPPHLRTLLDSTVADLINFGPPEAAMLTAGLFLEAFVPSGQRWAHLDIAGPAYHRGEPHGYTPRGGTGAGVRALVQLADGLQRRRASS